MKNARYCSRISTDSTIHDLSGAEFASLLDARVEATWAMFAATDVWKALQSPGTPIQLLHHLMREVYLEIACYQPHVAGAAITSIGQMPRSMDGRTVKAMLCHQAEEFTHAEMALRAYAALGGDVEWARAQRPSPAAYALASVWSFIAHDRDPFGYLGALFPSEGLALRLFGGTLEALLRRGFPEETLEFVTFQAEEAPRHAALVRALIEKVASRYPDSRESMLHGIDNLLNIYPLPIWQTAFDRAIELFERGAATDPITRRRPRQEINPHLLEFSDRLRLGSHR